jgi:hypothetical protein
MQALGHAQKYSIFPLEILVSPYFILSKSLINVRKNLHKPEERKEKKR